jgi:uridylate kinase
MKKIIVISLGGSLIIPNEINSKYLIQLKEILKKHTKKYKFVIVCGGGSIARKYINALKKEKINQTLQSFSGISATRMNARFMNYLFNKNPKQGIPHTTETLEKYLKKSEIIFCGALEYKPNQTSDSTSARLAKHFNTIFINLTNVPGLHDKNPLEHKDSKLIPQISWKEFYKIASKIKYSPGQHFVLDQTAAKIILKNKIKTYILGKNLKQLDNLLNKKEFKGTTINGKNNNL